jgi:aminocarboxymuconate-semialdehyde decarboxylase
MTIDTHAHIIVSQITRQAAPEEEWRPEVSWQGEQQVVDYGGRQVRSAVREFVDPEKIIAEQDIAGVERIVLCPWVNLLRYDVPAEEGLRIARLQNQALCELVTSYPERISALGAVPMQDPQLAAQEVRQIMREPGLAGVELQASVNGVYLGDDQFRPFWEAAEESGALVFIHPTTRGFTNQAFNQYYMWNTVGNPLETTITAAQMVMAGVLQDHPDLKVLLAHGGGALLALRGRLSHSQTFQPLARSRLKESPMESFQRFYYDTVVHDVGVLRDLVDFAGPDHVVVGSDYPFDMGVAQPAEVVRALNLSKADEEKILDKTAAGLLGLA